MRGTAAAIDVSADETLVTVPEPASMTSPSVCSGPMLIATRGVALFGSEVAAK